MTAVRPEGRQDAYGSGEYAEPTPYQPAPGYGQRPAEPDGWGVYDAAGDRPGQGEYPWLADQTLQLRAIKDAPAGAGPVDGGRAERRRAAQGRTSLRSGNGRRRAAGRLPAPPRPKESKGTIAARVLGELFITLGLVMLLFVSYQLWWTNVQADAASNSARSKLEQQFNAPPTPGQPTNAPTAFAPGQGFAIIHIPKIGLTDPIAEGTDTTKVLNKGLVGHYVGTALPSDPTGNFAVAGHRTTHGQPFRKLAELGPGDLIVVETATTYYTYQVEGGIPETPPTNVSVLQPIPKGSPFTQPGQYITMTTCTPEFSSRGRLIVFGKMIAQQPRSQGQPPALTSSS
ncbi:class E sortase [Kitasatospora sp. NPDC052896]|uniref:class E sortase n=1 Tax=Kitasatospora sp. NPDC052896 TaxID=3364061 RepID=UPI0037C85A57